MRNCEIFFKIKFETIPSETIRILGNIESLGSWNINKGLELKTNHETYPYWISKTPIYVPKGLKSSFLFEIAYYRSSN